MCFHRLLTVGLIVCANVLAPAVAPAASAGALTQLAGTSGCFLGSVHAAKSAGCAKARGMGSTQHVAISPDGRNVYASSNDTWGLVAFRRDAKTGKLRQLPGKRGCFTDVSESIPACTPARGLVWAFWVAVSPDGRNVYVTGGIGNAIAVFRRDPATGALTQLPGQAGCVRNRTGGTTQGGPPASKSGCQLVDGLIYPRTFVVSPDGAFVYAITSDGKTITGFRRDPSTGALSPFDGGCVAQAKKARCGKATNLAGGTDLTITRDGRYAYAAAFKGNALTAFSRDPSTGVLTQIHRGAGCIAASAADGCTRSLLNFRPGWPRSCGYGACGVRGPVGAGRLCG
jgi:DNA-binding beta-propeller fold protein YncE